MIKSILLVHPNKDIADQLSDRLQAAPGDSRLKLMVDPVRNLEDARTRMEAQVYDLIITHLYLPETSKSRPDTKQRGLNLLKIARNRMQTTPAILITVVSADLRLKQEISEIGRTTDIDEARDSIENIVELATKLLIGEGSEQHLSITFVQRSEDEQWLCQIGDQRGNQTFEGMLVFPDAAVDLLRKSSRDVGNIHEHPAWRDQLKRIGDQLRQILFSSNANLGKRLMAAIKEVGGIDKTRLCFTVSSSVHSIAFEAILVPSQPEVQITGYKPPESEEAPFWMLEAPVYRRMDLIGARPRLPLFEDFRENLNCLIIQAPTSGTALLDDGSSLHLDELRSVPRECSELEKWLRSDPGFLGNGEVCRVSESSLKPGDTFKEYLHGKLDKKEWHIVHYSGHSYYQQPTGKASAGRGYIFLPGDPICPVDVMTFAEWIKDAQLVTLSSCESAEENFAFELVRNLVPAVIGFRWAIQDEIATDFILNCLYPNLFGLRSIEKAFQQARVSAHKECRDQQIWAAPMLIFNEQRVGAVA